MGAKATPRELWVHGENKTYQRGCHCDLCKAAHRDYNRSRPGKPSLSAYRRQLKRKKERTPAQWERDFEFLHIALPDEVIGWIADDAEEDMDWIRRQLESEQTIWASSFPGRGGDVKPELLLDAHIDRKIESNETFRKNVLHWKGVIHRDTRTRDKADHRGPR